MADYTLEGPKWGDRGLATAGGVVTWAIDATVPAFFIPVIDLAFDDWSSYGNIQFKQVSDVASSQIDFALGAIDGLGRVLAETTYRSIGQIFTSAAVKFDGGESWHASNNHVVSNSGVDLFVVALHEIGHALGLDHYNVVPAVMNSVINTAVKDFTQSDIDGIRALYAASMPAAASGSVDIGTHFAAWNVAGVGDFNGDGTSDIIWRNVATGAVDQWQMRDGHWLQSIDLGSAKGADWQLAGTGNFNNDSNQDVLWFNTVTHQVDEWQMSNGSWAKSIDVGTHPGAFTIAGLGDFNGDGAADILWRDPAGGSVDEWQIRNGQWSQSINLGDGKGVDWQLAGIGDFNADGNQDVLWFNTKSGQVDEWVMKGGSWSKSIDLGSGHDPAIWQVAGIGDFNRDGTSDIKWLNKNTGQVDIWHMGGGFWAGSVDGGVDNSNLSQVGIGDFNHDGVSDTLLQSSSGELFGHFMLT